MKKRPISWLLGLAAMILCSITTWAAPLEVIPGGNTVGIKLYSQGVVITGFAEHSPAREAGLKKGDVIVEADGEDVCSTDSLRSRIHGEPMILTVLRKGKEAEFYVKPHNAAAGFQLGAYIRDCMAGIGTLTYYDPHTCEFGALGHGVSDADARILLPVETGVLIYSAVASVEKGREGEPGLLKGEYDISRVLGTVDRNTEQGIFGRMEVPVSGESVEVAGQEQIETGNAVIRSNVNGAQVREYSVEILKIYAQNNGDGRDFLIQVTDPALLDCTGGIVQGMSMRYNRDNTGNA